MHEEEDQQLRAVALQNAQSILLARQRAEEELLRANQALEARTAELADSLSTMRATLESTFDAILVTDDAGNVTDFNEKYLQMWGLTRELVANSTQEKLLAIIARKARHPDEFAARVHEIYASAGAESLDLLELADGRLFERFSCRQLGTRRRGGRVWSFRDITERKHAEQAARESADRLRFALSAGHLGDWSWDAETDRVFLSAEGAHIFGLAPEAPITWAQMHELLCEDDRERASVAVETALSARSDYDIEYRITRPSGEQCWIAAKGRGTYAEDGSVLGMVGVVQDITEHKRAEEVLRGETRILELLNETGMAIASELDLQVLLQTVTDAATQLSGAQFGAFFHDMTNAEGESLRLYTVSGAPREALESFELPRYPPGFSPAFQGDGVVRSADITNDPRYATLPPHYAIPNGSLPVRSYLAVPVISRSGEVIGGLFFGHSHPNRFSERTERFIKGVAAQAAVAIDNAHLYEAAQKAAEERTLLLDSERAARSAAERMSEMKDLFLANLSHELRTPLNAIIGWSQVLRRGSRQEADYQKGLETIERNARVQTQLIEDLLDMSRITSGKVRLDIQPVAPLSFIEAAIETVRPAADAKDIRIEKLLDPAAGPISGDPGRLQQVLWNLLSNAIKFTRKGGKVQVLLERVNSHIEIHVADTGIGIKPEFLAHVFERFRQADASSTRSYGGLGLGLAIVKHLVELHGGTVRAQSPGEGRGTTFSVTLPLTAVHRPAYEADRFHPRTPSANLQDFTAIDLSGIKVLVVDDEPDARDLISRVLIDCHAEVFTASTADEALQLVERQRPDVLVSDIGMPQMDGYELLRRMRTLGISRGGRIPAIALTAFARSEDRTRALRAGFLVHVSKPVEPSELIATVAAVSGRHEADSD